MNKTFNQSLKKAYGVENLYFYAGLGGYHCKYVSSPDSPDAVDTLEPEEFAFVLKSLSMGQLHVIFDGIDDSYCIGLDEVKRNYLIFKLSSL